MSEEEIPTQAVLELLSALDSVREMNSMAVLDQQRKNSSCY